MSQQAECNNRLALYHELNDIVAAMKNLAQVELHRVNRMVSTQQEAWQWSSRALAVIQQHTPATAAGNPVVHLLLGSERGFCAGFNEQLLHALQRNDEPINTLWVAGSRLAARLPAGDIAWETAGPASADDVLPCMQRILDNLDGARCLRLLSHTEQGVIWQTVWPQQVSLTLPVASPGHMPLAPLQEQLQWQLLQQSLLHHLLQSLRLENRQRLQQMEAARDRLTTLTDDLKLQINRLRQQRIVEEIAVILADRKGA